MESWCGSPFNLDSHILPHNFVDCPNLSAG